MVKVERTAIHDLVDSARAGSNPYVICKLETCWVAASDQPFLPGHCVTWADPVVFGLNDLTEELRMKYWRDVCRVGDALIKVKGAYRINYETLCNVAQSLHTHIIPRFESEPEEKRRDRPVLAYPKPTPLDVGDEKDFLQAMNWELARYV